LSIVIANLDLLCASFYDTSCDMNKCVLIVAIERKRRCDFAIYISVELKEPLQSKGAFGKSYVFGFEGWHGDELLLSWLPQDSPIADKEDR